MKVMHGSMRSPGWLIAFKRTVTCGDPPIGFSLAQAIAAIWDTDELED
ncbi:MAG TPA: hypothetical protein VKZ53_24820 [Candidatus Angelobacter sp.]|nr:hypothetical protein [Candidatus Angelobacter sp.]